MSAPKEGELIPRGEGPASAEGEFIPAGEGAGGILDPHSVATAADGLRGRAANVDVAKIDEAWVMQHLVKEATDFGTRTRQSSRIKALELIGKHLGMFEVEGRETETDEARRRAADMSSADRMQRLARLLKEAGVTVPVKH